MKAMPNAYFNKIVRFYDDIYTPLTAQWNKQHPDRTHYNYLVAQGKLKHYGNIAQMNKRIKQYAKKLRSEGEESLKVIGEKIWDKYGMKVSKISIWKWVKDT